MLEKVGVRQWGKLMSEGTISVIDLAAQHGMRKQTVFKILARLGIETVKRPQTLKCSAPFTKVLATWPCENLWEKTAIDCVTQGCE
jgi:hypothetical protein